MRLRLIKYELIYYTEISIVLLALGKGGVTFRIRRGCVLSLVLCVGCLLGKTDILISGMHCASHSLAKPNYARAWREGGMNDGDGGVCVCECVRIRTIAIVHYQRFLLPDKSGYCFKWL